MYSTPFMNILSPVTIINKNKRYDKQDYNGLILDTRSVMNIIFSNSSMSKINGPFYVRFIFKIYHSIRKRRLDSSIKIDRISCTPLSSFLKSYP